MADSGSIVSYFFNAGPVVKFVMMLLLLASLISWTIIFQKSFLIRSARSRIGNFEEKFWSGVELSKLYTELTSKNNEQSDGLAGIFASGFKEFVRLRKQQGAQAQFVLEGSQRAMRVARSKEMDAMEQHLPTLATIGSTSPYVGLFGTVWGIMTSFHALGTVQQATISMVAPGISEALVATAMGLFAAIPAVIAYNRFSNQVDRLENQYETFQEEFSNILQRQSMNVPQV